MRKLILLSIVLLTTLSATLSDKFPGSTNEKEIVSIKKETKKTNTDSIVIKKLLLYDAKEYLKDYEHKQIAKKMLLESMKKD